MIHNLIERDEELDRLESALAAASRGEGGTVVIGGPAGIGKTALLRAAGDLGRARGMTSLRADASELEHHAPFGVARQLFEPPLAALPPSERASLQAGPAGATIEVLALLPASAATRATTSARDLSMDLLSQAGVAS